MKWKLTDDSSMQHVRKVQGETDAFNLIEYTLVSHDPEAYKVYTDTIDVSEFIKENSEELEGIINGFGYDCVGAVKEQYDEDAMQVIAECIFEHYSVNRASSLFSGTEGECIEFIKTAIKFEGDLKDSTAYRISFGSGLAWAVVRFVIDYDTCLCEQSVLDRMIDNLEKNGEDGWFLASEQATEIPEDEYVIGGNHGRYLYHKGQLIIEPVDVD